jgi:hypothetical protein
VNAGEAADGERLEGWICMLVGRRSLGFADARIGSGDRASLSISACISGDGCSGSTMNGDTGSGMVRAAGGKGGACNGAPGSLFTASWRYCMLECLRGNWKSM